jgi:hypothetical protein
VDTPLGQHRVFSNAAAHGLAVTELKPRNHKAQPKNPEAEAEALIRRGKSVAREGQALKTASRAHASARVVLVATGAIC